MQIKFLKRYYGKNFEINLDAEGYIEAGDMYAEANDYDMRTGYLSIYCSGTKREPFCDTKWYENYLKLNAYIHAEGPKDKQANFYKSPAYGLLYAGYIPIGFSPSFLTEATAVINKLLEQQKIPYIRHYTTSFNQQYYRSSGSDIWVSKMDAAEVLGCTPDKVTSLALFREIIKNGY